MFKFTGLGNSVANSIQNIKSVKIPLCFEGSFGPKRECNRNIFKWILLYNDDPLEYAHECCPGKKVPPATAAAPKPLTQFKKIRKEKTSTEFVYHKNMNYLSTPKFKRISPDFLELLNQHKRDYIFPKVLARGRNHKCHHSESDHEEFEYVVVEEGYKKEHHMASNLPVFCTKLLNDTLRMDKIIKKSTHPKPVVARPLTLPKDDVLEEVQKLPDILAKHLQETMENQGIANKIFNINFYPSEHNMAHNYLDDEKDFLNLGFISKLLDQTKAGQRLSRLQMKLLEKFFDRLSVFNPEFVAMYMQKLHERGSLNTHTLEFVVKHMKKQEIVQRESLKMFEKTLHVKDSIPLRHHAPSHKKVRKPGHHYHFDNIMKKYSYRHKESPTPLMSHRLSPALKTETSLDDKRYRYFEPWNDMNFEAFKSIYNMNSAQALEYLSHLNDHRLASIHEQFKIIGPTPLVGKEIEYPKGRNSFRGGRSI